MSVLATGCFAQMAQWAAKSGQMGRVAGGNIETDPPRCDEVFHVRANPMQVVHIAKQIKRKAEAQVGTKPEQGKLSNLRDETIRKQYLGWLNERITTYCKDKDIKMQLESAIRQDDIAAIINQWKTDLKNSSAPIINEQDIHDALSLRREPE